MATVGVGDASAGYESGQRLARYKVHRVNLHDESTRGQASKTIVTGIAATGVSGAGAVILVDAGGENTVAVGILVEVDPHIVDARFAAKGLVNTVIIGIQPHPLTQAGGAGRQDYSGIP